MLLEQKGLARGVVDRFRTRHEEGRLARAMEALKRPGIQLPEHVFLIPDGDRRGAEAMGLPRTEGHRLGADVLWKTLPIFQKLGIPNVTVWIWSQDNQVKRGEEERDNILGLTEAYLPRLAEKMQRDGTGRFLHIGRKDRIAESHPSLLRVISQAEDLTTANPGTVIRAAIDYDWRTDLAAVIRGARSELGVSEVAVTDDMAGDLFERYSGTPPVDCLIRTSGEQRTSGLGLLVKDAEFVSIKSNLPVVQPSDFAFALLEFSQRQRRSGK